MRLNQKFSAATTRGNDIHVRNVYYAERSAGQPRASEHAGRRRFVALRQCSAWPIVPAKYFNERWKRAASRRLQAVLRIAISA